MHLSGVRPSVRPSVCPSLGHSCCGAAGRRYRSIAARRTAAAGECGQCHVVSVRSS